jgi:hypothetical protein
MKIILIIVIFILLNAFFIISNYNLSLQKDANLGQFFLIYGSWILKVGNNIKGITGQAITQNWIPENITKNSSEKDNL